MSDCSKYNLEKLANGETIIIAPHGNSMTPKIYSGDSITVEPVLYSDIEVGDVVLCKVRGNIYVHLVKAHKGNREQFLIGNNHGHINGWTKTIYGRVIKIGDKMVKVEKREIVLNEEDSEFLVIYEQEIDYGLYDSVSISPYDPTQLMSFDELRELLTNKELDRHGFRIGKSKANKEPHLGKSPGGYGDLPGISMVYTVDKVLGKFRLVNLNKDAELDKFIDQRYISLLNIKKGK